MDAVSLERPATVISYPVCNAEVLISMLKLNCSIIIGRVRGGLDAVSQCWKTMLNLSCSGLPHRHYVQWSAIRERALTLSCSWSGAGRLSVCVRVCVCVIDLHSDASSGPGYI